MFATYISPGQEPLKLTLLPPSTSCSLRINSKHACVDYTTEEPGQLMAEVVVGRIAMLAEPLWVTPGDSLDAVSVERRELAEGEGADVGGEPDPLSGTNDMNGPESIFLSLCWLLLVVMLVAQAFQASTRLQRPLVATYLPLLIGSLAIRFFLATWGPGDIRQLDGGFIVDGALGSSYGQTTVVLARFLTFIPIPRDHLLVLISLLGGSIAPLLVLAGAYRLGLSRFGSLSVALVICFHPWLVRSAGEGSRMGLVLFLGAVYLWALVERRPGRRLLAYVTACCAAALLLRTRPETVLFVGFGVGLQFLFPPMAGKRDLAYRGLATFVLATLALLQLALLNESGGLGQADSATSNALSMMLSMAEFPYSPSVMNHLDPNFTPIAAIAVYFVGVFVAFWKRTGWMLWTVACLLLYSIPLLGVPRAPDGLMQLASARYQTLTYIPFALIAGVGMEWLVARCLEFRVPYWHRRIAIIVVVGGLVASWVPPLVGVTQPTAQDDEYRMLREALVKLPANSRVYSIYEFPADVGLVPPDSLTGALDREDVVWRRWPVDLQTSDSPQFLATQSACEFLLYKARADSSFATAVGSEPGYQACIAARQLVDSVVPPPFTEQTIELRDYLMAGESRGQATIGLYRLEPAVVEQWLSNPKSHVP